MLCYEHLFIIFVPNICSKINIYVYENCDYLKWKRTGFET
jgi:hypothetical protein